ncbi:tripartite tricarboxylate transporter TctB family protein [Bradyrhizobium canariense]|uniref:Tripartite tricarboxylate transporter TctB family protein n=1 Tax=Bradyrhizobium canariense TaxID=255045 RepID=A0A1H1XQG8_9BRAD|nr:tripartite tricarboxylate transporter TctB family protein [Bradyrhizobium canariense]SDT11478.1 Tripartite tricarboxylate transporter TctB family protein [Bradyrhizobium canariense]
MKPFVGGHKDHYAGGLIALIGLGTIAQASRYDLGTAEMMGSGFFPIILGGVLLAVGVLIFVSAGSAAANQHEPEDIGAPEWRGWVCIIAGMSLFIFLAERYGLLPATFACVFVSALGDKNSSFKSASVLAAGMSVLGIALFSYGLKIPLPVLNW